MLRRRFLFSLTAAGAATAAAKSRSVGPVRKVFESPGPKPNGLQAAEEGLWIVDQGDNHAYLVAYENGKVLRDLPTAADRSSGITFDGEAVWLASTYSRELIRADAQSGEDDRQALHPRGRRHLSHAGGPARPPQPVGPARPGAQRRRGEDRLRSPPRDGRSRPRMAGRQAVGCRPAVANHLSHRPADLAGRAQIPHGRKPPARHRLGRAASLGVRIPISTLFSSMTWRPGRCWKASGLPTTTRCRTA